MSIAVTIAPTPEAGYAMDSSISWLDAHARLSELYATKRSPARFMYIKLSSYALTKEQNRSLTWRLTVNAISSSVSDLTTFQTPAQWAGF